MTFIKTEIIRQPDSFNPHTASEVEIAQCLCEKGMSNLNHSDIGRVLVDLYARIDELTAEIAALREQVHQQ